MLKCLLPWPTCSRRLRTQGRKLNNWTVFFNFGLSKSLINFHALISILLICKDNSLRSQARARIFIWIFYANDKVLFTIRSSQVRIRRHYLYFRVTSDLIRYPPYKCIPHLRFSQVDIQFLNRGDFKVDWLVFLFLASCATL